MISDDAARHHFSTVRRLRVCMYCELTLSKLARINLKLLKELTKQLKVKMNLI